MKIKCEYCGAMIEDSEDKCPNCGAPNVNVRRTTEHTPKTIEELKAWYEARKLPPYETTRFFIGIDYKEPRAFGIYRDGSEFVVYKNKGDGTRAVRYRGTDEAYAVNELYLKLKSEILNQKAKNGRSSDAPVQRSQSRLKNIAGVILGILGIGTVGLMKYRIILAILLLAALVFAVCGITRLLVNAHIKKNGGDTSGFIKAHPKLSKWLYFHWTDVFSLSRTTFLIVLLTITMSGFWYLRYTTPHYYTSSSTDTFYVNYHNDWYEYDSVNDDYLYINHDALPTEIQTNPADYEFDWNGAGWNSSFTEFKDSSTYDETYKSSDSWDWGDSDSDYDWDSGDSWDTGGSDWDSDW